jgi:hypothetical protein
MVPSRRTSDAIGDPGLSDPGVARRPRHRWCAGLFWKPAAGSAALAIARRGYPKRSSIWTSSRPLARERTAGIRCSRGRTLLPDRQCGCRNIQTAVRRSPCRPQAWPRTSRSCTYRCHQRCACTQPWRHPDRLATDHPGAVPGGQCVDPAAADSLYRPACGVATAADRAQAIAAPANAGSVSHPAKPRCRGNRRAWQRGVARHAGDQRANAGPDRH